MLDILALSYNDLPPVVPLRGRIPAEGGGLGRGADNVLVLPDPARLVSRRHGLFALRDGAMTLMNVSDGNPFFINDIEVAPGTCLEVSDADLLHIGGYVLRLRFREATPAHSPADSRGDSPDVAAAAPAQATSSPVSLPIPDDFDPFDVAFSAAHRRAQTDVLNCDGIGLDSVQPPLTPFSVVDSDPLLPMGSLTRDPLLESSAADLVAGDELDPLLLFGDEANQSSLLDALRHTATTRLPQPPESALAASFHVPAAARARPESLQSAQSTELPPTSTSTSRPSPRTGSAAPCPDADPASIDALREAFERGLGLALPEPAHRFSPDTLELVGRLTRSSLAGMLALLNARSVVKREVGAGVTLIEPRDNNPLKFSPDVEVALGYLFGRKLAGFMPAERAVDDAFSDLCTHQLGMVAGMRAAMTTVIGRFEPERVEASVGKGGGAGRLLPSRYKAECWDEYRRRYGLIAESLDDEFHELYGKAFLSAYDEETKPGGDLRAR